MIPSTSPTQLAAEAERIIARADDCRLLLSPATPQATALRLDANVWLRAADSHLSAMSESDALTVIARYDILHRIARGTAAPADTLNRHILAAFRAMTHGDTTVDQYTLFSAISDALNRRRDPAYLGAPLRWYSTTLARWHRQLTPAGKAATGGEATDYDTARRIDILLHEDLTAFEGTNQPAYKSALQGRQAAN